MKNIFIIFLSCFLSSTGYSLGYTEVYQALLTDAMSVLDGNTNVSIKILTSVTNEAEQIMFKVSNNEISDQKAIEGVIDIYIEQEGLYCKNLAETISKYYKAATALSDSILLAQCTIYEDRINDIKNHGWNIPGRIQNKYDSLITVRNNNERLFEMERNRRISTPGFYVTSFDNDKYMRIQLTDSTYNIRCIFPSPENPVDPRPAIISSGFYASEKFRGKRPHGGIDIPQCENCPIVAIADGFAKPASDEKRGNIAGKYVEQICPQLRLMFKYVHLNKHKIHWPGEQVSSGQVIGLEGRTGHATGPHLHLEVIFLQNDKEYKLNGKYLFSDFANRIVKDEIYLEKTKWGYRIISKEIFNKATFQQAEVTMK